MYYFNYKNEIETLEKTINYLDDYFYVLRRLVRFIPDDVCSDFVDYSSYISVLKYELGERVKYLKEDSSKSNNNIKH